MEHYIELCVMCGENTDLMLELLGTLVYTPSDKWIGLMESSQIIDFLQNQLMNGYAEDDIVLECVMLCGTLCRSDEAAEGRECLYTHSPRHAGIETRWRTASARRRS